MVVVVTPQAGDVAGRADPAGTKCLHTHRRAVQQLRFGLLEPCTTHRVSPTPVKARAPAVDFAQQAGLSGSLCNRA
jgi:hypothetical protein